MQSVNYNLVLTTSLDWPGVNDELKKMRKMLPNFSGDFYKFIVQINTLIKELGNIEIEIRTGRSHSAKELHASKIKEINTKLQLIKKIHLMGLLSR